MSQCYIRRRKNKQFPYTIVDFIKFDGTANSAYTTAFTLNADYTVSVTFDYDKSLSQKPVFATTATYAGYYSHLMYQTNGEYVTSSGTSSATFDKPKDGKHTFVTNKDNKNYFDGEEVTSYQPYSVSYYYYTIGFGWGNVYYAGKIYEFIITSISTGKEIVHYVPVSYDDSGTTRYGFYDTVSKTLITKTGWTGGYDPIVEIVSWADGTDEQIKAMIDAADAGEINLADYWSVGDERTVHLSAMTAGDGLNTAQPEQDVVLVLMNEGYPGNPNVHFVWGQKDSLSQTGRMNTTNTNTGSWNGCAMRIDLNNKYYNALPATFRSCLKQFNVITAESYNGSTNQTSQDYISLFAEQEVFGARTYSTTTEATALSQIEYYKTASNRIKQVNSSDTIWWERSPRASLNSRFCIVDSIGNAGQANASNAAGVAPFGCI